MTRLNRILFALLAVFVATALVLAVVAVSNASDAKSDSAKTSADFRAKVTKDQAATITARIGSCKSSTDLRGLLVDIVAILHLEQSTDPETLAVARRIHAYTDTNPNCAALTPEQRAKALGEP